MSVYLCKYGFMLADLGTEAGRFHIFSPRSDVEHLHTDLLDRVTGLSSARNPSPLLGGGGYLKGLRPVFPTAVNYNPVFISIWVGLAHEATVKLQLGPADNRPCVRTPNRSKRSQEYTYRRLTSACASACSRGYKLAKHAPVLLRQVRVYWGRH